MKRISSTPPGARPSSSDLMKKPLGIRDFIQPRKNTNVIRESRARISCIPSSDAIKDIPEEVRQRIRNLSGQVVARTKRYHESPQITLKITRAFRDGKSLDEIEKEMLSEEE
ncbi:hypothetical protein JW758_06385 [Candidatus Peregrinibacteria bacterium]|nr:hypothetical protein [Candidatus Peregrinibacteria bacterium]